MDYLIIAINRLNLLPFTLSNWVNSTNILFFQCTSRFQGSLFNLLASYEPYSTVAGKCKTTLQSVKHFYEARDKFTFWKTFLPIIKHNYMGKTLLPRTKQIYILENKLTRRKTLLPVPKQIYNDRFFTERECTTHRKWRVERCCCWWAR